MSFGFEVVETGRDSSGEYVTVWDGGKDKHGHRAGLHTFYGPGNESFRLGAKLRITLAEIQEAIEGG